MNKDESLDPKSAEKLYFDSVQQSFQLYLINLLNLLNVTQFVEEDALIRRDKHLPSEEDKNFTTKLFDNPIIQTFAQSEGFQKLIKRNKLSGTVDKDLNRKFYFEFSKKEDFRNYINNNDSAIEDDVEIILAIYKHLVKHELFEEHMDDISATWTDDKSLVVGAMKKTIKNDSGKIEFFDQYSPDKETVEEFGAELLHKAITLNSEILELIKPKLKNWEADRVATIDMILLKMAVCELMHFPTIPTKVTLNEYVDISKIYSTPKSKEFINGILDKLMKQLKKQGKIEKTGRGLME
ncbi:MAG: transcription antitermination factor NusB [Bacteroidota bacterium]